MNKKFSEKTNNASPMKKIYQFFIENTLIIFLFLIVVIVWGIIVAPFDWDIPFLLRDPVPVDALPDISENQQIIFTRWPGRSPRDIEDQLTYPLTTTLLGIPGVKTVRSNSVMGFSSIYLIFEENVDFYWARSRILERLNSLPSGTLPEGVLPQLGPDATALGQIFWYTVEGRDENNNPSGGWDLDELRSIQDWYVRYALQSAEGVSEVASVGGFVREYQIDVNPDEMRLAGVSLSDIVKAIRNSNIDVGANTIEINNVEYIIRGIGFIKNLEDIELTVIKTSKNIPISIKDIAVVNYGPATRRGVLDKEGAEVVGGVVAVRFGENPLKVIQNIKEKISEIEPGLPKRTLPDGTISRVQIIPFYDRTELIYETLDTLNDALTEEIIVTVIVILLLLMHFSSAALISGLLPIAVLMTFIFMKLFGVDANIVALAGIAIAIGTMVDMGIVLTENIYKKMSASRKTNESKKLVLEASSEVGGAVITALLTTVVSFLPIFTMIGAEGKLFKPLAYTKTFALIASMIVSIIIIPPIAYLFFKRRRKIFTQKVFFYLLMMIGIVTFFTSLWWLGLIIIFIVGYRLVESKIPAFIKRHSSIISVMSAVFIFLVLLSNHWMPLGPEKGGILNFIFASLIIGTILTLIYLFYIKFNTILRWSLRNKKKFLSVPILIIIIGLLIWLGFPSIFNWLPGFIKTSLPYRFFASTFPGLGKEFMPPLDEGAFLFMPTTMPHASIGEVRDVLQKQDIAISSLPEVELAVGKLGRVDSPLDPAPISMIETVINYKPKYLEDDYGERLLFKFDKSENDLFRNVEGTPVHAPDGLPYYISGRFIRDKKVNLTPDTGGKPFRLWRPPLEMKLNPGRKYWRGIENPDDIWNEIVRVTKIPGTTSAPKLQPINARIVMLQSGMRAPMGIKIKGPSLELIEKTGIEIETLLKKVPSIKSDSVIADRIVGKPYLEINIKRESAARYGLTVRMIQDVIEHAIGGKKVTETVEGRERYPVRVRYQRELRNSIEALGTILVTAPDGTDIPLKHITDIKYVRGPQSIKSEDTFLVSYVLFDKKEEFAEVNVVEQADKYLKAMISNGELILPEGVSYSFAGTYENQVRAGKRIRVILPLSLFIIFIILYLKFRSVGTSILIFSSILVAWAGGFILIWLYAQNWFLDISIFGMNLRELFHVTPINLSVAVWVGFLALFGIASDNGVIMASYLNTEFGKRKITSKAEIREAVITGAERRIRPALMTTATTLLALVPVLTSSGRGSDILVPMAIPTFGGMFITLITLIAIPVIYSVMKGDR